MMMRAAVLKTLGASLGGICLGIVLANSPAVAQEQTQDALILRLEALEQRVRKLEQSLQSFTTPPKAVMTEQNNTQPAMGDPSHGKQRGGEITGEAGWQTALFSIDEARRSRERSLDEALYAYPSGEGLFTLGSAWTVLGGSAGDVPQNIPTQQPFAYEQKAIFTVTEEGWHSFILEFTFPSEVLAGYLGGFYCPVQLFIDGEKVKETRIRQAYSARDPIKQVLGSADLSVGRHEILYSYHCVGDGRHAADPLPAIKAITVQNLLRLPGERQPRLPAKGFFQKPLQD